MDVESELRAIFFEEGREHIASLEEDLMQLETVAADGGEAAEELVNRIFRAAHTIKGGAGSVGLTELAGFTHTVENVLDRVRERALPVSRDLVSLLLACVDCVSRMLDAAMAVGTPPDEATRRELVERLGAFLGEQVASAQAAADAATGTAVQETATEHPVRTFEIALRLAPGVMETGTDPLMLLAELADLGQVEVVAVHTDACPTLDELDPHHLHLSWDVTVTGPIRREDLDGVFLFVADESPIEIREVAHPDAASGATAPERSPKPSRTAPKPKAGLSSVRVDTERLDRLVNLVGELVIGQARVAQITGAECASPDASAAVQALDRITRDLQDEAMGMRMLPIGPTFVQFQRVVRDLAVSQGKEVALEVSGQDTELDKSIIEKIGDPLKHMVRNAVDHGLEPPEERLKAGKPAQGALRLSAYHAEGSIVIEISEDGRGLDTEAIAAKAIREGVIPADHNLAPEQIHQLVFHPGLSTARQVTDVSGRGVGMDVVKRNIEQLRGRIDIETARGEGTTFKINLPLTLAIIDGMAVAVGEQTFLIPLLSIAESMRPRREDVSTVSGKGELVNVRGTALPLIRLHELLGVEAPPTEAWESLVMIVESGGHRHCLLVDDILGQQQVVIKTMEQNYRKVEGVAGASILADGRVAMILDIAALVRQAFAGVR